MKEFLSIISELIGQLEQQGRYNTDTLQNMKIAYERMPEVEQQKCLKILADILDDNKIYAVYVLSTLLIELEDKKVIPYIEEVLESTEIPLWRRISDMYQMRYTLFAKVLDDSEVNHYQKKKQMYKKIMFELRKELGMRYRYIPYQNRKKTVIIVVSQLVNKLHAPTKKTMSIVHYLKQLGYKVYVYVSFYWGEEGQNDWYIERSFRNFKHESGAYHIKDTELEGYNMVLNPSTYILEIRDLLGRIWDEAPEYVLELGDEILVADLCRDFTTVVTMTFSKAVPVTSAPIIARYFSYSEEEDAQYHRCLEENQIVIDVKHTDQYTLDMPKQVCLHKSDFGIPEQCFTIIIAGNRLDTEISDSFLKIIYQILEKSQQIVIACIGNCDELQLRIADQYKERVFFLGNAAYFRETIAIGDLFLNPPRQGGGTGGFFAIMEQIPVITLDHCDVADVGKEFTCESIEEMPQLVERYYLDHNFMKRQKEVCLENAKKLLDVDSVENFRKLCNVVKEQTLRRENNAK